MANLPGVKTVIVVPCYNEAHRLPKKTFQDFLSTSCDITLIFVDDGSTDATLSMLEELRGHHSDRVQVLHREVNAGKGEAVRQGMLQALGLPDADFVGFWDADLATPLAAVSDLLQVLLDHPEIQMVFGARVKLLGRYIERLPIRHYLGRVFATVVSVLLRMPVYDTQCGAKIFRVTPVLRQLLTGSFCSRWVFDVEILARFIRLHGGDAVGASGMIYEFPLYCWRDVAGSKVKPADFFRAFSDVVKIYNRYLRS